MLIPTINPLLIARGVDYDTSGTQIVFPASELQQFGLGDSLLRCINVSTINDTFVEGEHTFTVEMGPVSPSSVISCSSNTTVHIVDNDGQINAV